MKDFEIEENNILSHKYSDRNLHPDCRGFWEYDAFHQIEEFECGYPTTIDCEDCKYGTGRKNPAAKCNTVKGI
jgi:hypothetical protein